MHFITRFYILEVYLIWETFNKYHDIFVTRQNFAVVTFKLHSYLCAQIAVM